MATFYAGQVDYIDVLNTIATANEVANVAADRSAATDAAAAALVSQNSAATSATNAANSASTASTQAGIATAQANSASTSATNAANSNTTAGTRAAAAATSQTAAAASATAAAASQTSATNSQNAASTSATNASNSAAAALVSQNSASTSATNASNSAAAALVSQNSASTSATNASNSAAAALVSQNSASTSATNASNSAAAALVSQNSASTSATNAANSATTASTQAGSAATSATNAAASYDAFDDRYLGNKAADPTLDNDGAALLTGAIYWNTAIPEMRVWNGTVWVAVQSLSSANSAATSATNAASSAAAALVSQNSAATSATSAASSAAAALVSQNSASTSATNASNSAAAALVSQNSASTSATNASNSAAAALTSQNSAATSATNAASSAAAAVVSQNSAATSATNASNSATTATTQANSASTSATNAANSATSATNSAAAALVSQNSASTSATNAATSEANALIYRNSASTSATNAASSAAAALVSQNSASTSATNAASSASAALTSQNSAATSATNAGSSATLSQNWATQLVTPVDGGEYSAKYWAQQAAASIVGNLVYRGSWSAAGGSYPATPQTGDYYKVSVAGTVSSVVYDVNDSIIYNGTVWDKIDNTESFNPAVPGTIGGTTPGAGNFSTLRVTSTTKFESPGFTWKQGAGTTGYGVIARNDGADFYIMPTALNDADGGYSTLRPFYFSLSTGKVTLGNGVISPTFESNIGIGNAPLIIASTTKVDNLNADLLDGQHGSYYAPINSPSFTGTPLLSAATVFKRENDISEGGQFYLERPLTSTTLVGNVVIDLNGDLLRIFDSGGTNKGAYLNITTSAAGAGSKILTDTNFTTIVGTNVINDYGIGVLANMDTVSVTSGKYRWANTTVGRPAQAQANEYGTLLNLNYDDSLTTQLAHDIDQDNLYIRTLTTGTDIGTTWRKVWTDGNDGSASGLDADLLDGSHRDTTYNSYGNNTIPVRAAAGYLYSNYFNAAADIQTVAPSHVAIQTGSDNFYRWQTWAQFQTNIREGLTLNTTNTDAITVASTLRQYSVFNGPIELREVNRVAAWTSTASSISGTTLTIGGTVTNTVTVGSEITGTGVAANSVITGFIGGSGGAGTYTVSPSQTVATTAINALASIRNAPAITFHWSMVAAAAIKMNSAGGFELRGQDDTETGTVFTTLKAKTYESTQTTGTAPFVVASTTKVANLNVDALDGLDSTDFYRFNSAHTTSTPDTALNGLTSGDANIEGTLRGWHWITSGNTRGGGYTSQLAMSDTTLGYLMHRVKTTGTWGGWTKVHTDSSSYAQQTGLSTAWGTTATTSTGAYNAIMGTTTNATWLLSGTSGGVFKAGIQVHDSTGEMRLYSTTNYVGITATGMNAWQLTSTATQGTQPIYVTSTTKVTNLNADLIDGIDSTQIIYGGANGSNGSPGATWSGTHISQYKSGFWDLDGTSCAWAPGAGWWWCTTMAHTSSSSSYLYSAQIAIQNAANPKMYIRSVDGAGTPNANPWKQVWHEGSDGPGSGLDADLLDGQHGSYYAPIASPTFTGNVSIGTTDSNYRLAVYNNAGVASHGVAGFIQNNSSYNCDLTLYNAANTTSVTLLTKRTNGELWLYQSSTNPIAFHTNGTARLTIDGTSGAVTIAGDLIVNGTTTTINSTTLTVDDKNIELGSVASPTDTTADGGGITLRGATDKTLNWVSSSNAWTSSHSITTAASDGFGHGLWAGNASTQYGMSMSSAGNVTYGGRITGETTSDYNLYLTMGAGTNRGFIFRTSYGVNQFAINPDAVRSNVPVIVANTVQHTGLVMTSAGAGAVGIDQKYTFTTASIVLNATTWTDTGISGGSQLTGTPSVYTLHMQTGANEFYTGTVPWYSSNGSASMNDSFTEIPLMKTGDGNTVTTIYLRILRTASAAPKLQLSASGTLATYAYSLQFRRIL